jgi:hypothetical protein
VRSLYSVTGPYILFHIMKDKEISQTVASDSFPEIRKVKVDLTNISSSPLSIYKHQVVNHRPSLLPSVKKAKKPDTRTSPSPSFSTQQCGSNNVTACISAPLHRYTTTPFPSRNIMYRQLPATLTLNSIQLNEDVPTSLFRTLPFVVPFQLKHSSPSFLPPLQQK